MAQLVTRVPDRLAEELDRLVGSGVFDSRSDAVREALASLIDRHLRAETARRIVEGYERIPQSAVDIEWADAATVAMIAEEPWDER